MIEAMLMSQAAKGGVAAEDVFSTTLYTGNAGTQTITNGIELAGEGGLVWQKNRDQVVGHVLTDSVRGITKILRSETTDSEGSTTSNITSLNSDGFSIATAYNSSGINYASWTFRQAPKFFDIVQYTGDGVIGRQIAHDLGVAPGMIVVKRLDSTGEWSVYHKSLTSTKYMYLDGTGGAVTGSGYWNNQEPTDSLFYLGSDFDVNVPGSSYIAYLFAHEPSDSGIIQCGSYTGNGTGSTTDVTIGWRPQYLMIKASSTTGDWVVIDSERGLGETSAPSSLNPNLSASEGNAFIITQLSDGFRVGQDSSTNLNLNGQSYIYLAIRAPE